MKLRSVNILGQVVPEFIFLTGILVGKKVLSSMKTRFFTAAILRDFNMFIRNMTIQDR